MPQLPLPAALSQIHRLLHGVRQRQTHRLRERDRHQPRQDGRAPHDDHRQRSPINLQHLNKETPYATNPGEGRANPDGRAPHVGREQLRRVDVHHGEACRSPELAQETECDLHDGHGLDVEEHTGGDAAQAGDDLQEDQHGTPPPAIHDEDVEEIAGDLDKDAQDEVGVGVAQEAGRGEREAEVAQSRAGPLVHPVHQPQGGATRPEKLDDGVGRGRFDLHFFRIFLCDINISFNQIL